MTHRERSRGFTLLELAIVLMIIALITAMATTSGIAVLSSARQGATVRKMSAIDQALQAYAATNNRIPCPADLTMTQGSGNFGVEAANPWSCSGGTPAANFFANNTSGSAVAVAEGAVPAVTLGVSPDLMYDGWGNKFRYAVDVSMTKTGMFQMTPASAQCGSITIADSSGYTRSGNGSSGSVNMFPNGAIYALISHGANGHGAYSKNGTIVSANSTNTNELTNCHCNSLGSPNTGSGGYEPYYVQGDSSGSSTGTNYFDDLVSYKERWQMPTPWDQQGSVCPALYVSYYNGVEKFDMNGNDLGLVVASTYDGGSHYSQWGGAGSTDSSGNIWVNDAGDGGIYEYTSSGTFILEIANLSFPYNGGNKNCVDCLCTATHCTDNCYGSAPYACQGTGEGQPYLGGVVATGIALDGSGHLWVVDQNDNLVMEFSTTGQYMGEWGSAGTPSPGSPASGKLTSPAAIAVDHNGYVWVANNQGTYSNRVQKFTSSGSFVLGIGAGYNGVPGPVGNDVCYPGAFALEAPTLAVDAANNLWVSDMWCARVQKFSPSGTYLQSIPSASSKYSIGNPQGVFVDNAGDVWVDTNCSIMEFSAGGGFMNSFNISRFPADGCWMGLNGSR